MSDGHTLKNGQNTVPSSNSPSDFMKIPSPYDTDSPRPDKSSEAASRQVFAAESSDDVPSNHPAYDLYNPDDLNNEAFTTPETDSGYPSVDRLPSSRPNQFHPLGQKDGREEDQAGMPMPESLDDNPSLNLPTPGVIPDASEVVPPIGQYSAASTPESISQIAPESAPGFTRAEANPSPAPFRNFITALNPLSSSSADENRYQSKNGGLGGLSKKELKIGYDALNKGKTYLAYTHFRNGMAGHVGENRNRKDSKFKERMWKNNSQDDDLEEVNTHA